jgi:hypothetical protein
MERNQGLLFTQMVTSVCLGGFVLLTGAAIVIEVVEKLLM